MFALVFTRKAQEELDRLEDSPRYAGLVKQIQKTLGFRHDAERANDGQGPRL